LGHGGPKPPASARPAPGGRFAPVGSGAGLCPSRTCGSTGQCSAQAGETRVAFPGPARTGEGTVTASMAGAIAPATAPQRDQDRPGAQSPRPAPAPPPAGASRPPGRALAFRGARTHRSTGHCPARAGETRARFLIPPELKQAPAPLHWQGPSPLPQRRAGIRTGRGPKTPSQRPPRPWRALRSRRVGRWPLSLPDLRLYRAMFRAGGGNAGRVSPSQRANPYPRIRTGVLSGQRAGRCFSPALTPRLNATSLDLCHGHVRRRSPSSRANRGVCGWTAKARPCCV